MTALITLIHILICLVLIVAVLLQSGKAADLAGAFGGGGSQTAFGPRGTTTLLSKVTTTCAVLFMLTSLGLWMLSGKEGKSAVSGVGAPGAKPPAAQTATQPAAKPDEKAAATTTPPAGEKPAPAKTEAAPPTAPVKK